MICNKCGINTWYLYNGLCFPCSSNPVVWWATPYTERNWYECPDCKGKFTIPSIKIDVDGIRYKCPWCKKVLEGYNG